MLNYLQYSRGRWLSHGPQPFSLELTECCKTSTGVLVSATKQCILHLSLSACVWHTAKSGPKFRLEGAITVVRQQQGFTVGLGKTLNIHHSHTQSKMGFTWWRLFARNRHSITHTEQRSGCRVTHLEFPTATALPETSGTHCSSLAEERRDREISASAQGPTGWDKGTPQKILKDCVDKTVSEHVGNNAVMLGYICLVYFAQSVTKWPAATLAKAHKYSGSIMHPLTWVMAYTVQALVRVGACASAQTKTAGRELNGFADGAKFQQLSRLEHKTAPLPPPSPQQHPTLKGECFNWGWKKILPLWTIFDC